MGKGRFRLTKKTHLMNRLMQVYSLLLVGIILLVVAALCVFTADSNYKKLMNDMYILENRIHSYATDKENTMSYLYMELASSNAAVDNVRKYLNLSPSEYFEFTQKYWDDYQKDTRVSSTISGFFTAFPDLEELFVTLDGSNNYLKADQRNHNGQKLQGKLPKKTSFLINRPIVDQYSFQTIGQIYGVFSESAVLGDLAQSLVDEGIDAFIVDSADQVKFSTHHQVTDKEYQALVKGIEGRGAVPQAIRKNYYVIDRQTSKTYSYVLVANKQVLWWKNVKTFSLIILLGGLLASLLLLILHRTFKRYFQQVETIVGITHSVAEGRLQERIDLGLVQDELLDLSQAINYMIDSLDQYIKENYELEIKQRDAHMRALQSQINPHFLYNTLEYIRMYALSKQQKELADVVYAFSALLRNNTTQEKTTSLKKELSFCEKYVYLYQMRYPDRVAYRFTIEPELEQLVIPKFSLQPLIENYFVHGIDYTRNDNAISVKAFFEGEDIVIQVIDNGKGMESTSLQQLQANLRMPEDQQTSSIGMRNVYERLKNCFDGTFSMSIESQIDRGTTITIRVEGGKAHVV
ncbi:sensor histidine kinase [Enterococcus raffinosus]|jgi:two-component system sensor histidine kinase YesM|uniref:sensor histidine kinase n=2 Tax=Enterococcus raffinosus TaxID=71452 RepID=UPI0007640CC2|nr:sensor histidine kinase [Enterococcus raffinosus]